MKANKGQRFRKSKPVYLIVGIMTCKSLIAKKEMQIEMSLRLNSR